MNDDTLAQFNKELVNDPHIRNCNLKAELRDGILVVIGKVRSYYLKQRALHLAMQWAKDTYVLTTEIVVE